MLIGKFRIRKKRNDILEDLNSGRFDAKPGVLLVEPFSLFGLLFYFRVWI